MTLVMYTHLHSFKFSLFLLLNWPLRREHREYFIIILQNCDYWKCLKIVFILCYILSFIYEYIKDNSMNKKRFVVPTHPGIRWFVITFQIDCCTTRRHALAQEKKNSLKKTRPRPRKRPRKKQRPDIYLLCGKKDILFFFWSLSLLRACFLFFLSVIVFFSFFLNNSFFFY